LGDIGDFFEGIGRGIGDFFGGLWEGVKQTFSSPQGIAIFAISAIVGAGVGAWAGFELTSVIEASAGYCSAGTVAAGEFGGLVAGGAAAGATAGGLHAAYYGGNIGKGMLTGAGYGAAAGAVTWGLGHGYDWASGNTGFKYDSGSQGQQYNGSPEKSSLDVSWTDERFVKTAAVYVQMGEKPAWLPDWAWSQPSMLDFPMSPLGMAGAAEKAGATAFGKTFSYLFGKAGVLNTNRYLRIGLGRDGGDLVFRIAGNLVKKLPESWQDNGHIILKIYGPLGGQ
jgi:hypothetical protein